MASAAEHYEALLAEHYSWAFGGHAARVQQEERWFEQRGFTGPGLAVDLGAGSGFQSLALAKLGYAVTALDSSLALADELRARAEGLDLTVIVADLCDVSAHVTGEAKLVVCKGDTLPHLPSSDAVRRLFESVYGLLEAEGSFVLTFRDLSVELTGVDRIIPVRAEADRTFLCFLEYLPECVRVHDVIQLRTSSGWVTHKSWYPKLRLDALKVERWLREAGFAEVGIGDGNGMLELTAHKTSAFDSSRPRPHR